MSEPEDLGSKPSDDLFARAKGGDEAAWRELFDKCYPKILRTVRQRLKSPAMRSLYDSTDFVGDVWQSLAEKRQKYDFPTMEALVAFMKQAAERKVIDEHRRLHTLKHDINRDRPIAALKGGDAPVELRSSEPTPSQYAQARETRELLLSGQSGVERQVVELKDKGYDNEEAAKQTGLSVRQVQRLLKSISDSWLARRQGARP